MTTQRASNRFRVLLGLLAAIYALWQLLAAERGVEITRLDLGSTPATLYRPVGVHSAPMVVIAHGFAGSQQLMQSFALTFARNGYLAVTFDFPGHGRNPAPLSGDIAKVSGATQHLLAELTAVGRQVRPMGDGRMAVLGHSMASDIVVRYAEQNPDIVATVAVSMYSPAVTAATPANLLIIVGDWEGALKREALRAVGLATAPLSAKPGVTYGDFAQQTARRTSFSPGTEHLSVLFSQDSQRAALAWLDQAFGTHRSAPVVINSRGPWILVLLAGLVLLGRPLAAGLPRLAVPALGAGLAWRKQWWPVGLPMVLTPLVLRVLPTHFLPVLVGDYLSVHFGVYGLLTLACLRWRAGQRLSGAEAATSRRVSLASTTRPIIVSGWLPGVLASLAAVTFTFMAVVWPVNSFFTNFVPGTTRVLLIAVMLPGTLLYVLADEWLTTGVGAARGAYAVTKLALVLSLALAVALDFQRLFFLVLILPMIVLFFLIFGLLSRWTYERTGNPLVGGVACALMLAWAIGVTFPIMPG